MMLAEHAAVPLLDIAREAQAEKVNA